MTTPVDVVLIGGGIMSATLGTLLQRLQPDWTITVIERRGVIAEESSNPWNNAGTGHSALCELNYSPEKPDGTIDVSKAIQVNEQFQVSRQLWTSLVEEGVLPEPSAFLNPVPHMTFVWGEKNVDYLRRRYELLKDQPLFRGMEFSDDARVIRQWAPLLIPGRAKSQPIAATRAIAGTDIDFGSLTRLYLDRMVANGARLITDHKVTGLRRKDGLWTVSGRNELGGTRFRIPARFVFVGAGGAAITLLQRSGIREIRGYGGFPISGKFLRTDDPDLVAKHQAKVYGKASVGAPPMSVPHLDTRVVDGSTSLLFGPYAGWTPKFLKFGSWVDFFGSIRWHNLGTMVGAGLKNLDLVVYLAKELFSTRGRQMRALQEFFPNAKRRDWRMITAGQRVQIMKRDAQGKASLQFGTEVVASADGSIAGLLGASPGASTAPSIMLDVLARCFPDRMPAWRAELTRLVPSYGTALSDAEDVAAATLARTAKALGIPG